MTLIHDLFSPFGIAGRWALLFVPVAIKSGLLLGLITVVTRLMRGSSASARHLVWTLGMVSLLLLPLMEVGLPSWHAVPVLGISLGGPAATQDAGTHDEALLPPVSGNGKTEGPVSAHDSGHPLVSGGAPVVSTASREPGGDGSRSLWAVFLSLPATVWCFWLWLSGAMLRISVLAWGSVQVGRFRSRAVPLTGDGWPKLIQSLSRQLGLVSPPTVLRSRSPLPPMTWGLRNPIVLLPEDCSQWTAEQRRGVLLHEMAHVTRRDCHTQLLAQIVCLLHWFNPLAWMAAARMRAEREMACDDRVLMAGARPSSYAGHLLNIAKRMRFAEHSTCVAVAMACRSGISNRLDALLDPRPRRLVLSRRTSAIAVTGFLAVMLPLATLDTVAQTVVDGTRERDISIAEKDSKPPHGAREEGSVETRGDNSGTSFSWNSKRHGTSLNFKMKGKIVFSEDESGIEWMDDGAHFKIESKKNGRRITIEAEPGEAGVPVYTYKVGRKTEPFDNEAAALLAGLIQSSLLHLGINADVRVRKTYDEGGTSGVVSLIDQLDGEYFKGIYYAEYFTLEDLSDDDVGSVLEHLAQDLSSDYEMASALMSCVDNYPPGEGSKGGFMDCMSSIDSDYEKARVLKMFLHRRKLTHEAMSVAFEAAEDIDSDYEAAAVLRSVHPDLLLDERMRHSYFKALQHVDSDYQKAEVLLWLLPFAREDKTLHEDCRKAADLIDSDHEYSRVVRALR
jgi:beta-lactamase regulating signal transducer with metallopeptidase domain